MNLRQKIKILSWALIIILIFDVSAIATLIYKHRQFVKKYENREQFFMRNHKKFMKTIDRKDIYKDYLIKEINLTKAQQQEFDKIRKSFISQARIYFDSIRYYNNIIDSQLRYNNPDTLLIDNYSSKIGSLHKTIKIKYIKYNLQIKSILNKTQKKEYFDAFIKFRNQCSYRRHRQPMNNRRK